MIAVVTGGGGFIGQNLVRRLLADGHEVRCLMRPNGGSPPKGTKRYVVQFEHARSLLECAAFDDASVVFHLAGLTKAVDPDDFNRANVGVTRNVLGAITARRLYPKFVYVSSQAAAGPAHDRAHAVTEDDVPHPVEPYGRSKLEAERLVQSFADRVPATIIRPCAVFGAHDRAFFALFRLASHGVVAYPGTAEHWLSLLHVDDVVDGLLSAVQRTSSICRTYFLASDDAVRWRTLGEIIAAESGRRVRHIDVAFPIVQTASIAGDWIGRLLNRTFLANRSKLELARQRFWICSGNRARSELGFRPARSLPDAVRDTYYWYRQSGWLRGSPRAAIAVA